MTNKVNIIKKYEHTVLSYIKNTLTSMTHSNFDKENLKTKNKLR